MDSAVLVQVLGSILGSTVLVSLLTAYFNRRKLGAEATDLITKAATGVVSTFKEDNVRLREEAIKRDERVRDLEKRLDAAVDECQATERRHHRDMLAIRETLQDHAAFDFRMIQALEENGFDREFTRNVPPLLPPHLRAVPSER